MSPYSSSAREGSRFTAKMPGATGAMSAPMGAVPKSVEKRSFALHAQQRTRLPRAAYPSASAAVTVVFPTPPLPVTKTKRVFSIGEVIGPALL